MGEARKAVGGARKAVGGAWTGAGPSDAWGGVRLWEKGSGKPGWQPQGEAGWGQR